MSPAGPADPSASPADGLCARHGDKLRFLVVGAINTGIYYLLFLGALVPAKSLAGQLADGIGIARLISDNYFLVAQWTAWVVSVPIGTWTLGRFVFGSGTGTRIWSRVPRAYLVYLPSTLLASAVLWTAVQLAGLPPHLGQLAAIAAATVFSYLGHKHITFGAEADAGGPRR